MEKYNKFSDFKIHTLLWYLVSFLENNFSLLLFSFIIYLFVFPLLLFERPRLTASIPVRLLIPLDEESLTSYA